MLTTPLTDNLIAAARLVSDAAEVSPVPLTDAERALLVDAVALLLRLAHDAETRP